LTQKVTSNGRHRRYW